MNNFGDVLEKIRNGMEIVVEQDHLPVAIIGPSKRSGRPISECIASSEQREKEWGAPGQRGIAVRRIRRLRKPGQRARGRDSYIKMFEMSCRLTPVSRRGRLSPIPSEGAR